MKHVAILCGGKSYEHEVSVITGLQVAENLDYSKYTFSFLYFDKENTIFHIKNLKSKRDFTKNRRNRVNLINESGGTYIKGVNLFSTKQKIDVCYLAFHGGTGEGGAIQGMLELLNVPFTSASQEGSVITMNKQVTKEVLSCADIPVLPSLSVYADDYVKNSQKILKSISQTFSFPVIIKPVHLGSSIAIEIANNSVELEKFLNIAVRVDTEILIEPALSDFTEFNVSVRSNEDALELSPIEEPLRAGEVLTFKDKYQGNGSKKTGSKSMCGGMQLLDRTVPAKIDDELANKICSLAKSAYRATRLDGVVRIDFMYSNDELYCTEINPIPGSMAFYLWEAAGEQFSEQITISIENAISRLENSVDIEPYQTDIVEKFIG